MRAHRLHACDATDCHAAALTKVIVARARTSEASRVTNTTRTARAIAQAERLLARPIRVPPTDLDDLVGHIIDVDHAGVRQWLDVLAGLAASPAIARLATGAALQGGVATIASILGPHFAKEERVVFPYVRQLIDRAPVRARFRSLAAPLRQLDDEHAAATTAVRALCRDADDAAARAPGREVVALFATASFVLDEVLARHLTLEHAVLFPSAQAREHASRSFPS